ESGPLSGSFNMPLNLSPRNLLLTENGQKRSTETGKRNSYTGLAYLILSFGRKRLRDRTPTIEGVAYLNPVHRWKSKHTWCYGIGSLRPNWFPKRRLANSDGDPQLNERRGLNSDEYILSSKV
ncbi:unnamed protein product, partial [Nesidiocoris tenuis]